MIDNREEIYLLCYTYITSDPEHDWIVKEPQRKKRRKESSSYHTRSLAAHKLVDFIVFVGLRVLSPSRQYDYCGSPMSSFWDITEPPRPPFITLPIVLLVLSTLPIIFILLILFTLLALFIVSSSLLRVLLLLPRCCDTLPFQCACSRDAHAR